MVLTQVQDALSRVGLPGMVSVPGLGAQRPEPGGGASTPGGTPPLGALPPGLGGTPPGQGGTSPGHGGTPPGQAGQPPVLGGLPPLPGNAAHTTGAPPTPHGHRTASSSVSGHPAGASTHRHGASSEGGVSSTTPRSTAAPNPRAHVPQSPGDVAVAGAAANTAGATSESPLPARGPRGPMLAGGDHVTAAASTSPSAPVRVAEQVPPQTSVTSEQAWLLSALVAAFAVAVFGIVLAAGRRSARRSH